MQQNTLYVGNLPFETDENGLTDLFSQFGTIKKVNVITRDGRSRGFGFVTFETNESADEALSMHQQKFEGRMLNVNKAKDREKS